MIFAYIQTFVKRFIFKKKNSYKKKSFYFQKERKKFEVLSSTYAVKKNERRKQIFFRPRHFIT